MRQIPASRPVTEMVFKPMRQSDVPLSKNLVQKQPIVIPHVNGAAWNEVVTHDRRILDFDLAWMRQRTARIDLNILLRLPAGDGINNDQMTAYGEHPVWMTPT